MEHGVARDHGRRIQPRAARGLVPSLGRRGGAQLGLHVVCARRGPKRNSYLRCRCRNSGELWRPSLACFGLPPIRAHAEVLLAGVGEGVLFDELGLRPEVYHLRRRMTLDEIRRIAG